MGLWRSGGIGALRQHRRWNIIIQMFLWWVKQLRSRLMFANFLEQWTRNVVIKEDEKITNYSPVAKEIRKMLRLMSITIVPMVVGSLAVGSGQLERSQDSECVGRNAGLRCHWGQSLILEKMMPSEFEYHLLGGGSLCRKSELVILLLLLLL